jgi:hypothetical protein
MVMIAISIPLWVAASVMFFGGARNVVRHISRGDFIFQLVMLFASSVTFYIAARMSGLI